MSQAAMTEIRKVAHTFFVCLFGSSGVLMQTTTSTYKCKYTAQGKGMPPQKPWGSPLSSVSGVTSGSSLRVSGRPCMG